VERVAARSESQVVDDTAERARDGRAIAAAFSALSELDRETLRLVTWERLSIPDAARVAGCSAATFSVRLHRARRRLAGHLSGPGTAEELVAPARRAPVVAAVDRLTRVGPAEVDSTVRSETRR
jgi:DNA-directed RNA polymerase specialized sigma24 family protein